MKDLEKSGTKIYWNQASDEKSVGESVKDWMSDNYLSKIYIITDPDASFIKSGCRLCITPGIVDARDRRCAIYQAKIQQLLIQF